MTFIMFKFLQFKHLSLQIIGYFCDVDSIFKLNENPKSYEVWSLNTWL